MAEWEDFGRVSERHRSLSWTVERGENEDEGRYTCYSGLKIADKETESSGEERPCHVRKSKDQKTSTPECIDRVHSRPSEDEVGKTKSPRYEQSTQLIKTSIDEDCSRVECDDVDSACNIFISVVSNTYIAFDLHICCAIITIPDACVALRILGIVKSSKKRVKKLSCRPRPFSTFNSSS